MSYRQPTINFQHSSGAPVSSGPIGQPTTSYMVSESRVPVSEFGKKSIVHDGYQSVPVREHTHYQNTENLYRPLKETLAHPQYSREHAIYAPEVTKTSQVSRQYRRLDTKDLNTLQQNTYIPDAELVPTNNLDRVKGQRFVAVDATQRQGQPISQEQFERIKSRGFNNSQVVYEVGNREVSKDETVVIEKKVSREEKVNYAEPSVVYEEYVRQPDYKYNLFSFADKPVNDCRLFGCGKCGGIPKNEGFAKEHHTYPTIKRYSNIQSGIQS